MANKKINQLDARVDAALTDLLLIGDPTTGVSYKITGTDYQKIIAQNQYALVVNGTGGDVLASNYQAVKITGAQGQRLQVNLAQANNDANSTDTLGLIFQNIANNQDGFICTSGQINGLNTTGALQGETWADGNILYLSPTIAGRLTNIKPTAPNHSVIVGFVVYAHSSNGKIFTKVDNGYEVGELHDCYLPSPNNNEGIFWNADTNRYENKSVNAAGGFAAQLFNYYNFI